KRSADLLARYPRDPMAHLLRAISLLEERRAQEAEAELRATITLSSADIAGAGIRLQAQAILAGLMMDQGRHAEAKAFAADACRLADSNALNRALAKPKLCEWAAPPAHPGVTDALLSWLRGVFIRRAVRLTSMGSPPGSPG